MKHLLPDLFKYTIFIYKLKATEVVVVVVVWQAFLLHLQPKMLSVLTDSVSALVIYKYWGISEVVCLLARVELVHCRL